jgi:hypothetical protein
VTGGTRPRFVALRHHRGRHTLPVGGDRRLVEDLLQLVCEVNRPRRASAAITPARRENQRDKDEADAVRNPQAHPALL